VRKIINDPVHGFITISDELIFQIISHSAYQRLRRIKQMALAYLVYPGAVHTRLHHSLGAYHLMGRAIMELKQKGAEISTEEEQAAKIAILLHDIGHGPYSHALENTLVDISHEDISLQIMKSLNKEFGGKLDLCLEIFKGTHPKKFLHQLVSSQLDVDRLDYLARDSFFTGVHEGVIGYDRILKMLKVHNNELVVEEKGVHSIEKFLIARRLMYWQVYLHKTVLSSELMLVNVLKRAKHLAQKGEDLFATPALKYFLNLNSAKDEMFLENFLKLDDADISTAIKVWSQHEDATLSKLAQSLLDRKLFKLKLFKSRKEMEASTFADDFLAKYSGPKDELSYFMMKDSTENSLYDLNHEKIKILYKSGELKTIDAVDHPLINSGISEEVKKYYICVAE